MLLLIDLFGALLVYEIDAFIFIFLSFIIIKSIGYLSVVNIIFHESISC